jgi:hypothetical protein
VKWGFGDATDPPYESFVFMLEELSRDEIGSHDT